jgi:hypothetical protein
MAASAATFLAREPSKNAQGFEIMKPIHFITTVALAGALALASPVRAQPDVNNAPKGENPDAAAPRVTPEQMAQMRRQNEERRQQWREQMVRQGMAAMGYNDKAMQDAVIAHLALTDGLEQTLLQYQMQVAQSLMTLSNEQATTLLAEYKKALEDYQKKRHDADAALEAKIEYSTRPKLELALRLFGAIGDDMTARNMLMMMGQGGGQGR